MNKMKSVSIGLMALLLLLLPSITLAQDPSVEEIRESLTPYEEVSAVEEAGYAPQFGCIMHPTDGAMGIHYINGDLFSDPAIDPLQPEAVIYEPQADGSLQPVGLEYIVLQEAWHGAGNESPPTLLGNEFMPVTGFFDVPPFYALHLWLWRENPKGAFVSYNPSVACPEGEGVIPPNVEHHAATTPESLPETGAARQYPTVAALVAGGLLLLAGGWWLRRVRFPE
jgi:hypothetical protein